LATFANVPNSAMYVDIAHGGWLGGCTYKAADIIKSIVFSAQSMNPNVIKVYMISWFSV
jgi:cellulase/cellobiase CelA1